jgi:hypothetical protein
MLEEEVWKVSSAALMSVDFDDEILGVVRAIFFKCRVSFFLFERSN